MKGFIMQCKEHQRRARDALNQAVLESSSRCVTTHGITGCADQRRVGHACAGTGNCTIETMCFDSVQSTRAGRRLLEDNAFAITWIMNKECTLGILKRSLEIQISFAKKQNTPAACVTDEKCQPHICPGTIPSVERSSRQNPAASRVTGA